MFATGLATKAAPLGFLTFGLLAALALGGCQDDNVITGSISPDD